MEVEVVWMIMIKMISTTSHGIVATLMIILPKVIKTMRTNPVDQGNPLLVTISMQQLRRTVKNDHTVNGISSNEAERDEFGRVKSKQPKKIRWPPCFESHGSAFVLDTRSGMFYEA
jgi:hypothetical protein